MDQRRFDKIVDEASYGLHDDPELRLEVQEELRSHLLDCADAHKADGKNDEEVEELAMADFGSSVELASSLLEANRKRMKLRAVARLLLRRVAVSVAIMLAGFLCFSSARRFSLLIRYGDSEFSKSPPVALNLSPKDKLLFYGDTSRPDRAAQQRAIWENQPGNPTYYANYITHLLSSSASLDHKLKELEHSAQVDPKNSRYDYLRASLLLEAGAEVHSEKDELPTLKILDRAKLDEAMHALLAGNEKAPFDGYFMAITHERLALLPPCRRVEEKYAQIAMCAGVLLPDVSSIRKLARCAIAYAALVQKEGKAETAVALLQTPTRLSSKIYASGGTLIEELVAGSIAKAQGAQAAALAQEFGQPALAARLTRESQLLSAPVEEFKNRSRTGLDEGVKKYAGAMMSLLLPALGEPVTAEELRPGRYLEYGLLEQAGLMTFLFAGFCSVLICLLLSHLLRGNTAEGNAVPILILPQPYDFARILFLGVVLPLGVYLLYSRLAPFSAREFSFRLSGIRFLFELGVLGLVMYLLVRLQAGFRIRRRCRELGIALPARQKIVDWLLDGLVMLGTVAACLIGGLFFFMLAGKHGSKPELGAFALVGVAFLVSLSLPAFGVWRLRRKTCRLYRGSLQRSLVPHLALMVILVALIHPVLGRYETRLLQSDPLLAATSGFTVVEDRVVAQIRARALENMRELKITPPVR